ncbi:hypothetical protein D3C73_830090 [compost metagenome]
MLAEMPAQRPAQLFVALHRSIRAHYLRVEVKHFFDIVGKEEVRQKTRINQRLRELVGDRPALDIGHRVSQRVRRHSGGFDSLFPGQYPGRRDVISRFVFDIDFAALAQLPVGLKYRQPVHLKLLRQFPD